MAGIDEVVQDLAQGRMAVITDDENRENEGDIVLAARFASRENVNFITRHARGLLCAPMSAEAAGRLRLPSMDRESSDPFKTHWTVSVDAASGVTTGISAGDRARTLRVLADPSSRPEDLTRPGHVFPLKAKEGGVLARAGHTEACVDMLKLAGLEPVGVICEILHEDGTMARLPELRAFAARHRLKLASIASLIEYRRRKESLIEAAASSQLPTEYGDFEVRVFKDKLTGLEHAALVMGSPTDPVLVRVHSECLTGDVFASRRCDCGPQLKAALRAIAKEGAGILLYMRQEGRGIGLANKLKAYRLQEQGHDTVSANEALGFKADLRDYGIGAQILCALGVKKLRLLTNNPKKIVGLEGFGLKVVERVPLVTEPNPHNLRYLKTKKERMGHLL
ncbi:MAG TPA: bifunctional 3,4-dihydroxy-2-butanone-4-phosphate synthase/GTP cyclohydrolase II [Elusimicrobia bacterium]|nr:bifunctional 3,4-dihydroxy-2-butanone-4-phosphate synthase/GTP cyclohydrolase II [Elusimicrobiota bacterium]